MRKQLWIMDKSKLQLEEIEKVDPFKVPEGYFEGLTDDIMSHLSERVKKEPIKINLWTRVKPWMYMAAMFVGISLMVNRFTGISQSKVKSYASSGFNLNSSTDIEDFYHYYEDELAKIVYDDTVADLIDESY
jgi:hypothetical protein